MTRNDVFISSENFIVKPQRRFSISTVGGQWYLVEESALFLLAYYSYVQPLHYFSLKQFFKNIGFNKCSKIKNNSSHRIDDMLENRTWSKDTGS